ncbi:uncharacterized protein LOC124697712 [Lolium rigidum]|uniref:uncharacterized protein LOC124697712 n=1 Tax=Lolium rigidum TaxID=89674 RepID=UPI001F5DCE8B|nr:uncharacterized protein LOC124697712 [Lolium rigidum]
MPPRPPPAPATEEARDHEEEILLRLPPDDPGCLFRASLVCKPWRNLLTSPAFGRRYREFHQTPPLLGFFENHDSLRLWFEPSTPTSPFLPMHPDHRTLFVLDSRHGLVLLRAHASKTDEPAGAGSLIVWDPVGRRQWEFPPPEFANTIIDADAAVLCVADGCDHLGCHGDRFLVAYVGTDYSASIFSSETRAWSPVASCHPPEPNLEMAGYQPKALVGNVLYFNCVLGSIILRFDYISLQLSMIHGPSIDKPDPESPNSVLMKTEQGVLGCAIMQESSLCLWSMDTVPDGSVAWTPGRVIKLGVSFSSDPINVAGFADGFGVFYLRTYSGIFTVDLKSGGVKKILPVRSFSAIPYMSFYTPDQARAITLPSTMASSSENAEAAQDENYDPLRTHSSGQVSSEAGKCEEGVGWEEVGDGEKEGDEKQGGQHEVEIAQGFFNEGSKVLEDGDFDYAVCCLRCSLEIRVNYHGKLSPKCRDTYYRYGLALLRKAQTWSASNEDPVEGTTWEYDFDLNLSWKMLHFARVILEKSPDSTREKVKIFAALAEVSIQREDIEYSFIACFKSLTILAYLVEPYYHHIINLNIHKCIGFEFPKSGDAKGISLWKSRIQNLKKANEALLAHKGDDASATEICLEESSLAKDIQFVTNILLSALEKFSGSSNTMSTAETIGTTASTGTDLEAAGQGIK